MVVAVGRCAQSRHALVRAVFGSAGGRAEDIARQPRVVESAVFRSSGEDMQLFAVPEEGMVLACVAEDEDAMMSMLHCFDGHAPSLVSTHS